MSNIYLSHEDKDAAIADCQETIRAINENPGKLYAWRNALFNLLTEYAQASPCRATNEMALTAIRNLRSDGYLGDRADKFIAKYEDYWSHS